MSTWPRLLFSLALLTILFSRIGLNNFLLTFSVVKVSFIFFLFFISIFVLFLSALSLKIIYRPYAPDLPFFRLFKYFLYSLAIGIFFPANIGQFSLVYFLNKEELKIGTGTAILLLYKLANLFLVGCISVGGFFLFFQPKETGKLTALLLIIIASSFFIFLTRRGIGFLKFLLGKYAAIFSGFSSTMRTYFKSYKKELFLSFATSVLTWIVIAFGIFVSFFAFGINCPLPKIFLANSIVTIFSMIPVTLAGLGMREGAAVFLYQRLGLPPASVLSAHLLILCINYLEMGAVLLLLAREPLRFQIGSFLKKEEPVSNETDHPKSNPSGSPKIH